MPLSTLPIRAAWLPLLFFSPCFATGSLNTSLRTGAEDIDLVAASLMREISQTYEDEVALAQKGDSFPWLVTKSAAKPYIKTAAEGVGFMLGSSLVSSPAGAAILGLSGGKLLGQAVDVHERKVAERKSVEKRKKVELADRFAARQAREALNDEEMKRGVTDCTRRSNPWECVENLDRYTESLKQYLNEAWSEPVKRVAKDQFLYNLHQLSVMNMQATQAAAEEIDDGFADLHDDVATLKQSIEQGFQVMSDATIEYSLQLAEVMGLQEEEIELIKQGQYDVLAQHEELTAYLADHHDLVASFVKEERQRQDFEARQLELKQTVGRLAQLGALTNSQELVVAAQASSIALDLRASLNALANVQTASAALNPALGAAVAVMSIANIFSAPPPDRLQIICKTILHEVRELREMLAQGIDGLAENQRSLLRTMCGHFRLAIEYLQRGGTNTANAVNAGLDGLRRHESFWHGRNGAMIERILFRELEVAEYRYGSRERTLSTLAHFPNEVQKDCETLGIWASVHSYALNGAKLAKQGAAANASSVSLASFVATAEAELPGASVELVGLYLAFLNQAIGEPSLLSTPAERVPNAAVWTAATELLLSISSHLPAAAPATDKEAIQSVLGQTLRLATETGEVLRSNLLELADPHLFRKIYNKYVEALCDADRRWKGAWSDGDTDALLGAYEEPLEGLATDDHLGKEFEIAAWSLPPAFRAIEQLGPSLPNGGVHMRSGPGARTSGRKTWNQRLSHKSGKLKTGHATYSISSSQTFTVYLDFTDDTGEALELYAFSYDRGFPARNFKNKPKGSINQIQNADAEAFLASSIGPYGSSRTVIPIGTVGSPQVHANATNIDTALHRLREAVVEHISKPARQDALLRLTSGQLVPFEEIKALYAVLKAVGSQGEQHTMELIRTLPNPYEALRAFETLQADAGSGKFDPSSVPGTLWAEGDVPPPLGDDYRDSFRDGDDIDRVESILNRLYFASNRVAAGQLEARAAGPGGCDVREAFGCFEGDMK